MTLVEQVQMSAPGQESRERQFTHEEKSPAAMLPYVENWERLTEGFNAFDGDWRFTYVNRAAEQMLGWSRGELLGRRLWDVYPTLIGARPHQEYQRAMTTQTPVIFDEYHADTGRWFEFRAYPAPESLHVYFRDVTAQRQWLLEEHAVFSGRDGVPATLLSHLIALAENTPDFIIRFDREGRHIYVNPAVARVTGLPASAFLGKTNDEVSLPGCDARERWQDALQRVVETGEAVTLQYEQNLPDGTRIMEARFLPEYSAADGAQRVASVITIARDVTERVRTEETLRQSEERYRALVSATAQVVWTFAPDGRCIEPSASWEAFTGQNPVAMLGLGYLHMVHPDDRAELRRDWEYSTRTGHSLRAEFRLRKRDGNWRRVAFRAVPLRTPSTGAIREWVGTCIDITDQREAAAALRESEERYEAISSMSSDYAFAYRLEEDGRLRLEWITDAFTEISGYSAADLDRLGWSAILHADDVTAVDSMTRRVLVYGQEETLEAARLLTRSGTTRWLRIYARPRFGAGGAVVGFYGAAQDITEQKRAEAEMSAAHQKQRRIAETLQRSLLITPEEGQFPGLDIHPEYEPAWDEALVGGDFYDAFVVEKGRIAVVVGDVMGKGLTAAAYTAEVKFALRAFLREHRQPGPALKQLNDFIVTSQETDPSTETALVCAALAVIEPTTGIAEVATAGAEPPILLRSTADTAPEAILSGGPVLGITRGIEYTSATVHLDPDDLILLFTDGLTEARSGLRGENFFGSPGVIGAAQSLLAAPHDAPVPLDTIGKAILEAAQSFTHEGKLSDDACLLLVRRT